jgi:hypothetical protein
MQLPEFKFVCSSNVLTILLWIRNCSQCCRHCSWFGVGGNGENRALVINIVSAGLFPLELLALYRVVEVCRACGGGLVVGNDQYRLRSSSWVLAAVYSVGFFEFFVLLYVGETPEGYFFARARTSYILVRARLWCSHHKTTFQKLSCLFI